MNAPQAGSREPEVARPTAPPEGAETSGARVARNAAPLYAAEATSRVLTLALFVIAARALPAAQYGLMAHAMVITLLATVASDLGGATVVARVVAREPEGAARIVGAALACRASLSLAAYGAAVAFLAGTAPREEVAFAAIASLAALLTPHAALVGAAFRALGRASLEAALRTTGVLVGTIAAIVAVRLGYGIVGIAAGQALGALAQGALALAWGVRGGVLRLARPAGLGAFLREAAPFGVLGILVLVYMRVGVLVLERACGPGEVALYGSSFRIVEVAYLVPSTLGGAMLPVVAARLAAGEREEAGRVVASGVFLLLAAALPLAAVLSAAAPAIVALLMPRADYAGVGPVLAVAAWGLPAVYMSGMTSTLIGAGKRPGLNLWLAAGMVLLSAGGVYALAPRLGARGAAISGAAVEWAGLLVGAACASRWVAPVPLGEAALRPLLAAAIAAPALLGIGGIRGAAIAVPVYALALVALDREGRLLRAARLILSAARARRARA